MANISWLIPGLDDDWTYAAAWSGGAAPTLADAVTLGTAGTANYTVTISATDNALAGTLTFAYDSTYYTTLNLQGGSLTTAGAIKLVTEEISGFGKINNGGAISNGNTSIVGIINASGGTLEITGAIASAASGDDDVSLQIATTAPSTLKLDGTVTTHQAISLTNANQTLEIGAAGSLSLNVAETATGGEIKLDGGALTTNAARTLTLTSPALLVGAGTVDANWSINGSGTIKASGGLLDIKGALDATKAGTLQIDGSVAGSDLKLEGAIGGSTIHPTVAFTTLSGSDYGTLDLSAESATNVSQLGAISGFTGADNASTATSDAILVKGSGAAGDKAVWDQTKGTLKIETAGNKLLETLTLSGTYTQGGFKVTENGTTDTVTYCFMPGTRIATPEGEAAVETLKIGDLVRTAAGEARAINWIGRQTVSRRFADPLRSYPIRVRAGALGDHVPARDLLLSPDHALLVDDVLIHAGALVNGTSITRETTIPESFVYYHIEVDDHSLILAEGAPAETFVDNVDRMNFDNWDEFEALYPDGKAVEELPYPRAKSQRQVPAALRARLAERAAALGAYAAAA